MGIVMRMAFLAIAMAAYLLYAPPTHADPNSDNPNTDILGNAGSGGYDGIPTTPGDDIASAGALPEGFLAMPGPYLDLIGPGVYSSLEDSR